MRPREVLKFGEDLLGWQQTQPSCRAAINRAFLAAEHRCKSYIKEQFGSDLETSRHAVGSMLQATSDPDLKVIGTELSQLYGRRILADYDLSNKEIQRPAAAEDQIEAAKAIFDGLDRRGNIAPIDKNPMKKRIQDYLKANR